MGHDQLAHEALVLDGKGQDLAAGQLAPGKLRPEADADVGRDHIPDGGGAVALEDDIRLEAHMLAELIADIPELAGVAEADEVLVHDLV